MTNAEYGIGVSAFELYVYAVDTWEKIYGETIVYKSTTEKYIGPGKTIKSETIVIPNRSKISRFYCGIHKI